MESSVLVCTVGHVNKLFRKNYGCRKAIFVQIPYGGFLKFETKTFSVEKKKKRNVDFVETLAPYLTLPVSLSRLCLSLRTLNLLVDSLSLPPTHNHRPNSSSTTPPLHLWHQSSPLPHHLSRVRLGIDVWSGLQAKLIGWKAGCSMVGTVDVCEVYVRLLD
ncbi:uncharacterized protein LOC131327211 [Rhododendron vialii]|uniref:uncharacterized protein LOC131327211 n=1 Tax=Rhododendron vialii TaxID=182163 RepID=UPI00265E59D5|nr:uncharacterized protein LOC131327211 [Rhododendron vialii]